MSRTRSVSRPATSCANFLRANSSSARIASSVRTRQTLRCNLTGRREAAVRSGSMGIGVVAACALTGQRIKVGFVGDRVAVALFGQKHLPVLRKVELARVARYQRIKMRPLAARLWSQHAAEPLRFFLARAKCPRHLDEHIRVRQVDGEIPDLREYEVPHLAAAKAVVEVFALGRRGLAGDQRDLQAFDELAELLQGLADNQHALVGGLLEQAGDDLLLGGVLAGYAVLVAPLGDRVLHALLVRQRDAHLRAVGRCDPAATLQLAPGDVVLLRPDQAEDIAFPAILAYQRGRQSEPAARLNLGGDPKHRGGKQMHLVVDDQSPVALVEDLEVRKVLGLVGAIGDDLVCRQRNGADYLR